MSDYCLKCAKKREDCCRTDYAKFTTLEDAERIASFLNAPINEVAVYSSLSDNDVKTELFKNKTHGYYYDFADKDKKVLQLKKKEDGSCVFLDDNGACKIYPVRPLICRVYPFWYSNDEVIEDSNGISGCPILGGSKSNGATANLPRENVEQSVRKIGTNISSLKLLFTQLKGELENYTVNIKSFIKKNGIKGY